MKRFLVCFLSVLLLLAMTVPALAAVKEGIATIAVTSESIVEGKLKTITGNNKVNVPKGKNKSPQLTWTKVEGAKFYAIVMYDKTNPWLHWLRKDIKAVAIAKGETQSLKEGKFTGKGTYIGAYPPAAHGDHTYEIYVFALAAKPKTFKAKMNSGATSLDAIKTGLDTTKSGNGNILGMGVVTGTFKHGQDVK